MHEFRLIIDPPLNAAVNMARDRAILEMQTIKGHIPTLRIYRWSSPSVTIGYFQEYSRSVNEEYCRNNGISVTRRITGGGTVLHHRELTYSFTLPVRKKIVPESVEESFSYIISPLIDAVKSLSIEAVYKPDNDIIINGRKISGSAQVRKKGILQQHGTLILDIDRELISGALKGDSGKLASRGFKTAAEAVTSVCGELNCNAGEELAEDITVRIINSFSSQLDISFSLSDLSEGENAVMKSYISKFSSDEWNLMR